jgi:hypothetical protein
MKPGGFELRVNWIELVPSPTADSTRLILLSQMSLVAFMLYAHGMFVTSE